MAVVVFRHGTNKIRVDFTVCGSGKITEDFEKSDDNPEFTAALDGLTSLLLAMAIEGVDLTTVSVRSAVTTALVAIENNHCDD